MTNQPIEMLNDITFIRDMKHVVCGAWQQYDVLLEARGYGWDMMLQWADYMASADLTNIQQVTTGEVIGAPETECTEAYHRHGTCVATPDLTRERGVLTMAGVSRALGAPVKIVWVNQTRTLRLFTLVIDEGLMRRYIETVIRRTFGTPDAMKLAKPIPDAEPPKAQPTPQPAPQPTPQPAPQAAPAPTPQMVPQVQVRPKKAPLNGKRVLGLIVSFIAMMLGFCLVMLSVVEITTTVTEVNDIPWSDVDDGEVYFFDEVTVIDCVDDIYEDYQERWQSSLSTPMYTISYAEQQTDFEWYLVSYEDGERDTVYTILRFESYSDLESRCRDYVDALREGTAEEGDLVISGCFSGWGSGDSWYMSSAVEWYVEEQGWQDEYKSWFFDYQGAETLVDYRNLKVRQNIVGLILGAIMLVGGVILLVHTLRKHKRIPASAVVMPPQVVVPPVQQPQAETPVSTDPAVRVEGACIYVDRAAVFRERDVEVKKAIPLTERELVITLYEDGEPTRRYRLQAEGEEDFTGKYFLIDVRMNIVGVPPVPVLQIDGFISDTPEDRQMTLSDIGYRFQGHYLSCGGVIARDRIRHSVGQDLIQRGLKYPGYTTPGNVRLLGVCDVCGESFCFHGYAVYMGQDDVAYSDDGMDVCSFSAYEAIDKETWSCEIEGKTYRYYNSFCCPHCHAPYIDYKKHPENKVFGVSACTHLGRKVHQYRPE